MSRDTRTRGAAVIAAVLAAMAVWAVVTIVLGIELVVPAGPDDQMELGLVPVVVVALGSSLLGWAAASTLGSRAARPRRTWIVLALTALVLSLVPVFAIGVGAAAATSLVLLHVVVAAVLIPPFASTLTPGS